MESMATRSVSDIPAAEKQAIETLLGRPLAPDQQVFVLAYTPNVVPDAAAREPAKENLQQTFAAVDRHAEASGVTAEEADAAVDEAMRQIRPQYR